MISLIAAVAQNGAIGLKGKLPWHIPADLKRFKELTMGQIVVVGRKTFQTLPRLSGRTVRFVSKQCSSHSNIFKACESSNGKQVFIAGGAEIYKLMIPYVDRIYLTEIHKDYIGDTFFPEWDRSKFKELSRENFTDYSFVVFERI